MTFRLLLFFCALLPFQFALNPTSDIDLAVARIFSLIIFLFWLASSLKNKRFIFPKIHFLLPIVSFLFFSIFSLANAGNFHWALRKLAFLLSFFPLFFVASSYLEKERQEKIIRALLWGGWLLAFMALIQFFSQFFIGIEKSLLLWGKISTFFLGEMFSQSVFKHQSWLVNAGGKDFYRAVSIFPDPHMLAFYLELLLPFSIFYFFKQVSVRQKVLVGTLSFIMLLALALTFSRGAYFGIIAGMLSAIIIFRERIFQKNKLYIFLITATCLLLVFFTNNIFGQRLFSSFDFSEESNIGRFSMWTNALNIIQKHPLTGIGIGNFSATVQPSAEYRDPIYAHNLYFDIASETGILSALSFISLLVVGIREYNKKGKQNYFWNAGIISLVIFSTHSLFETPLYSIHVLPLLLIIIAIGAIYEKHSA